MTYTSTCIDIGGKKAIYSVKTIFKFVQIDLLTNVRIKQILITYFYEHNYNICVLNNFK